MTTETIELIRKEIAEEVKKDTLRRDQLYQCVTQGIDPTKLIINVSYPESDEYDFETSIVNLNLEEERKKGIASGRDFLITDSKPIQKEVKSENGIFSPKYGQTLSDMEPFIDRWRCSCGKTKHRIYEGTKCKHCGTVVKYVDDDFGRFAWLVTRDYKLIHPNLYKNIESMVGGPQVLANILDFYQEVDCDGHPVPLDNSSNKKKNIKKFKTQYRKDKTRKSNEPFWGKGMSWFYEHFDEVMDYYMRSASNKAAKKPIYERIYKDRDKVFTNSIPVYTTLLRPFNIGGRGKSLDFEGTNANYNIMSKQVACLNNNSLKMDRHPKKIEGFLWEIQRQWMDLYMEIDAILSGKKGNVRLLSGGRCNFSGRSVIIQNQSLRTDQVVLPYPFLVITLEQQIINALVKTYGISYNDAYNRWYKAIDEPDKVIVEFIYGLMRSKPEGLPVIINRNPSIQRGSLLQMFCVDMSFNYTMALPLSVLELLGADFDKTIKSLSPVVVILRGKKTLNCWNVLMPNKLQRDLKRCA